LIAEGDYRYRLLRAGAPVGIEEDRFAAGQLAGVRRSADGSDLYRVEAILDSGGLVERLALAYSRGPFSRRAVYQSAGEFMHGTVSAMGGRTLETAKLGRLREVDAGLVLFRALTLAHVRARGQSRWTGRVAVVEPKTLLLRSHKQSAREKPGASRVVIYESGMADVEEIELDEQGRIIRITDNRGQSAVLESHRAP
jgi:hypothetical protein